jgi:single-strand DNA-binding protein
MGNGGKVVSFTLATSETWKDKATGERREQTEWHRIVIFNPNLADVAERFLQKGTKVYVEGNLRTRKYTNQAGQEVYTTEVVLQNMSSVLILISGTKGNSEGGEYGGGSSAPAAAPAPREEINIAQIADDIPF